MKLGEWLDANGVTVGEFATRIERAPESVRRYISGERIPDKETMPLIARHTDNQVTANDFFGIEPERKVA